MNFVGDGELSLSLMSDFLSFSGVRSIIVKSSEPETNLLSPPPLTLSYLPNVSFWSPETVIIRIIITIGGWDLSWLGE